MSTPDTAAQPHAADGTSVANGLAGAADVANLAEAGAPVDADDAKREAWGTKHRASLTTSLKESAVSTFGYLESHNEDRKTKVKADLTKVARALDAALASNDLLRLAEAKFFMTRMRLAVGDDEGMSYLLERLGAAAKTAASARLRPGGGAKAPVYVPPPPPPMPPGRRPREPTPLRRRHRRHRPRFPRPPA